jgi:hypothetical protein
VVPNASFNVYLSAYLEDRCESLWRRDAEAIQNALNGRVSPSDLRALLRGRYRQRRFDAWKEYFISCSPCCAGAFLVPCIPDWAEEDSLLLQHLLSPEGQASVMHGLNPLMHPVGSLVVLPNWRMIDEAMGRVLRSQSNTVEKQWMTAKPPKLVRSKRTRSPVENSYCSISVVPLVSLNPQYSRSLFQRVDQDHR